MLRSVRRSVNLSVPFLILCRSLDGGYARVAVSNAFDRGQRGKLFPHPNAMSGSRGEGKAISFCHAKQAPYLLLYVSVCLSVCPSQAGIVYNVSLTHEVDGCVRPLNDVKSSLF